MNAPIQPINSLLKTITDHSKDLIIILDDKFSIILLNTAAEATYKRFISQEIIGTTLESISFLAPIESLLKNKEDKIFSELGTRLSLGRITLCWKAYQVFIENESFYILKANTLTEKNNQDEIIRLETLVENMPCNVYWMDKNCTMVGCNQNVLTMLNMTHEEYVGKTYEELAEIAHWPPGLAQKLKNDDLQVLQTGQPIFGIEDPPLPDAKHGTLHLLTSRVPLRNNEGEVIGVAGISVDISELKQARERAEAASEAKAEMKAKQTLIENAAQVSHDIRSPLAALNTVLRNLSALPEDQRILIRNAVRRINDIANNLLAEYRDESKEAPVSNELKQEHKLSAPELLSSLLDVLISEKKAQIGDRDIELNLDIDSVAFGLFVSIDPVLLKRTISNLLNNAIEAIHGQGEVIVRLEKHQDSAHISLQDTGKGIPPDVLEKIKQGGMSLNKDGGTGIGISSALAVINKNGGHFDMMSKENEGTTVLIDLPIAEIPSWFQAELILQAGTILVIVDDDESIHAIWDSRCQSLLPNITLKHFHHSKALDEYCKTTDLSNHQFLVDYELLGSPEVGLELIERLNLSNRAILVTSRYEEAKVREHADKLSVKIIPKNYSPYIPISLASNDTPKLIFIDDDKMLTSVWEREANLKNIFIKTFNRTAELRKILPSLAKNTPIYIDSNLREPISGEDFAKELYDQGFTELYLASGHPREHFGDLPWIKDFLSKEPPF